MMLVSGARWNVLVSALFVIASLAGPALSR